MSPNAPRKKYLSIFISPHLDDAVFSCAGEIAKQKKMGEVCVLNIFTHFPRGSANSALLLSDQRKKEETDASAILGYDVLNLEQEEAFFRDTKFESISNIFLPADIDSRNYALSLASKIKNQLHDVVFENLYIPLAVGWHIDHWITFKAVTEHLSQQFESKNIFFYEDSPYCLIEGATEARLLDFQMNTVPSKTFLRRYFDITLSFYKSPMMKNTTPNWLYYPAFPAICIYFFNLLRRQWKKEKENPQYTLEVFDSDITDFYATKLAAIKKYESQTKIFFKNQSGQIEIPYRSTERYWKLLKTTDKDSL